MLSNFSHDSKRDAARDSPHEPVEPAPDKTADTLLIEPRHG